MSDEYKAYYLRTWSLFYMKARFWAHTDETQLPQLIRRVIGDFQQFLEDDSDLCSFLDEPSWQNRSIAEFKVKIKEYPDTTPVLSLLPKLFENSKAEPSYSPRESRWQDLKLPDLASELGRRGLCQSGTRIELCERLRDHICESAGPTPRLSLLGMPPEIRNMIYGLAFPTQHNLALDPDITYCNGTEPIALLEYPEDQDPTALISTCRQIRREAGMMQFSERCATLTINARSKLGYRYKFLSEGQYLNSLPNPAYHYKHWQIRVEAPTVRKPFDNIMEEIVTRMELQYNALKESNAQWDAIVKDIDLCAESMARIPDLKTLTVLLPCLNQGRSNAWERTNTNCWMDKFKSLMNVRVQTSCMFITARTMNYQTYQCDCCRKKLDEGFNKLARLIEGKADNEKALEEELCSMGEDREIRIPEILHNPPECYKGLIPIITRSESLSHRGIDDR